MKRTRTTIEVMSDPIITLLDLSNLVDDMLSQYGHDAVLFTDAGYNNVTVLLERNPSKKLLKEIAAGKHK